MLFNSLQYAVFLPIVFFVYWYLLKNNRKGQNLFLLLVSYVFYGWWDWRFLFLLMFSTVLDYASGILIKSSASQGRRSFFLWLSIGVNLGFLAIFKYYDFFVTSFASACNDLGLSVSPLLINVVLPVGISFYTFHGLSYIIDVYKNRIEAERNITDYALFVSFFPLLVAGPIERATHLLPQIKSERRFDYSRAVDGLRQILWGLFKKIVIADNCAKAVNIIFADVDHSSGSTLVLGAVLFAFQIYGDFSGYSDIALGSARLFGIELLRNFSYPYFSRSIAEFWRRWHISLSSWFRDYLYIPLGGSQGSNWKRVRNVLIIFLVSGLWHGANWTFLVWGLINAVFILPSIFLRTNRKNLDQVGEGRFFPSLKEFFQILITFTITTFAWIFFRSESIAQALAYVSGIFSVSIFEMPEVRPVSVLLLIIFMLMIEWLGRSGKYALEHIGRLRPRSLRIGFYWMVMLLIFLFNTKGENFIYFQF